MSNIYPPGQCTWWAANQEPWCMRYGNLGNALDWSRNWQARGGVLAGSASVGAVANFQPGVDGARPLGHVAVVVRAGNPFVISEMNGPRGPGETDLRSCGNGPGVSFLVESTPAPAHKGVPQMWLYQLTNGTIYLVSGGTLLPLGTGADAEVYMAKGVVLYYQKQFTALYQATLAKLPVL